MTILGLNLEVTRFQRTDILYKFVSQWQGHFLLRISKQTQLVHHTGIQIISCTIMDTGKNCARGPKCASEYQSKLSGPLLDRFDLFVDVPAVTIDDLQNLPSGEASAQIIRRVANARTRQQERHQNHLGAPLLNTQLQGKALEQMTLLDHDSQSLMKRAAENLQLSARAYYRVLRVARTIADLAHEDKIALPHITEALAFRRRAA